MREAAALPFIPILLLLWMLAGCDETAQQISPDKWSAQQGLIRADPFGGKQNNLKLHFPI
jgi:hypothetical protein